MPAYICCCITDTQPKERSKPVFLHSDVTRAEEEEHQACFWAKIVGGLPTLFCQNEQQKSKSFTSVTLLPRLHKSHTLNTNVLLEVKV